MTRKITSYFHVDPPERSNKQRAEYFRQQSCETLYLPQPLPLGDRLISSRPARRCLTTHQSTPPQSVRGTNSRCTWCREPPTVGCLLGLNEAVKYLSRVFFLWPQMLGVFPTPTFPPGSSNKTPMWLQMTLIVIAIKCPNRPHRHRLLELDVFDFIGFIVCLLRLHHRSLTRLYTCL